MRFQQDPSFSGQPANRWLGLGLALAAAVAGLDLALGDDAVLVGLLVAPPLIAGIRAGPVATGAVAATSLLLAILLGIPDEILGSVDHLVQCLVVTTGGVLAIAIGHLREERETAAARLAAQQAVAHALAESRTLAGATQRILSAIGETLGWQVGILWLRDPTGERLCFNEAWLAPGRPRPDFLDRVQSHVFRRGEGLPGRVWASGRPVLIPDLRRDPDLRGDALLGESGLAGLLAFPLCDGDVRGVVTFFSDRARAADRELLEMALSFGRLVTEFLERVEAVGAAELNERRHEAILESAIDCVITINHQGRIVEFNPAAEATFGYSRDDAMGRELAELIIPPHLRDRHRAALARYVETGEGPILNRRLELEAMRSGGETFPVELTVTRVGLESPPLFTGYLRDISERQRSERQLREAEERFRTAFDHAPIGMALVSLEGRFLRANRAMRDITGYSEEELTEKGFASITTAGDAARDVEALPRLVSGELSDYHTEKRYRHAEGHLVWVHLSVSLVRDSAGEPSHFIAQVQDITERKRVEDQLAHQALHDSLTELPNRVLFADRLGLALTRSRRAASALALLFIDLDRFKAINDSLGHAAGDQVLATLAERLRQSVRPHDTVARLGGDEFTVLCENLDGEAAARAIVDRLRNAIEAPQLVGQREVFVTASIGIAMADPYRDTPDTLLSKADAAMYRAKQRGVGREELFEERMRPRALEGLRTETQLRRALARNELTVYYQPQVDLATEAVIGAEALVRWDHPERGCLAPAEFIAIAEETGLIVPIGELVLREACQQAQRWSAARPDSRPLMIALNLAPTQVAQMGLDQLVRRALETSGVDPETLCLEITERTLMGNAPSTVTQLLALKGMGVRLALDDFGTGYSSLGYLRRFPVDFIKVDRSFVEGLGRRAEESAIVAAIVNMGHSLGATVIAEGVEREDQLSELRDLGCDLAQGHLFAPARPPAELDELLAAPGPGRRAGHASRTAAS